MKKILIALLLFFSPLSIAQEKVSLADVPLKTLDNQTVSLSQYQGKPLYIKMWASWCPICLAGLAEIDDLSAEKNLDFNVITIASPGQKNEQNSQKFINWYKGLDYKNITVLLDENGEIIKRANVLGYPFNLLLDKDLNLIKAQPGHLNSDQIKQFVKE